MCVVCKRVYTQCTVVLHPVQVVVQVWPFITTTVVLPGTSSRLPFLGCNVTLPVVAWYMYTRYTHYYIHVQHDTGIPVLYLLTEKDSRGASVPVPAALPPPAV